MVDDEHDNSLFKGLPWLHRALSWLIGTWMLAPFWLFFGATLLGGIVPVFAGILLCIGISCYYLARGASSRWEGLKIWSIPVFFVFLGGYGGFYGHGELSDFGMQGVGFIAPAWLGEILRYKAHRRKMHVVAIYFLIQHALTLLVALLAYWANGFVTPSFFFPLLLLWYFSFPIGFFLFKRRLVLFAIRNGDRLRG